MKLPCLALLLACVRASESAATLSRDLDDIAKVATVMVDGDVCQRIVTAARTRVSCLNNPRAIKWADGDNYDVERCTFIATKKTLIRLSSLADYPVDVNLWMPLKSDPSACSRRHSQRDTR